MSGSYTGIQQSGILNVMIGNNSFTPKEEPEYTVGGFTGDLLESLQGMTNIQDLKAVPSTISLTLFINPLAPPSDYKIVIGSPVSYQVVLDWKNGGQTVFTDMVVTGEVKVNPNQFTFELELKSPNPATEAFAS